MTREEALQALEEYRVSIDALDLRLLELLNERTQVVEQIGRVKRAAKLPIYEPRREEQVFENITTHNGGPLSPEAVKRIFERIIDEMRTIQRIRMQTGVETGTDGDL
ncbi:MAG TPA: chorismate mutase [Bryobacteraceae bacterium]|nr:chorismate mutase [Bryobacteraceae bacterium]